MQFEFSRQSVVAYFIRRYVISLRLLPLAAPVVGSAACGPAMGNAARLYTALRRWARSGIALVEARLTIQFPDDTHLHSPLSVLFRSRRRIQAK